MSGRSAKKISAAEKIIDHAETINEAICRANAEKEKLLSDKERVLARKAAENAAVEERLQKWQTELDHAAKIIKAETDRLHRGFANLQATIQREVQRALARFAPFKELFSENQKFKERVEQVQRSAERTTKKKSKGDIEL